MSLFQASLMLAILNFLEFVACAVEWYDDSTAKNLLAAVSWFGSTVFWLFRSVMPV